MNKLTDAKEYLEKALEIKQRTSSDLALEIKQRTSSDLTTDNNVATTLHAIGQCLMEMNKLTDDNNVAQTILLLLCMSLVWK